MEQGKERMTMTQNKSEPKKEIVTKENSPMEMIKMAVSGGADLEKLEKLLELQLRWEANEAKKAYNDAMVVVHQNILPVAKTLKNPTTHSRYASLDMIICQTKEIYTAQGFSISFYEGQTEKPEHIRLCADVIHRLGHKESYYYDAPMEGKGLKGNVNMTPTHAKASSVSYARRYLMCMIWNIPTGDDNDGNGAEAEKIDENKIKIIRDLIVETKADEAKFLGYLGVEKLEDMTKPDFLKAKTALEAKKAKVKNADN